jgi:hypothetical protein
MTDDINLNFAVMGLEDVDCTYFPQGRIQWQVLVNVVMKYQDL